LFLPLSFISLEKTRQQGGCPMNVAMEFAQYAPALCLAGAITASAMSLKQAFRAIHAQLRAHDLLQAAAEKLPELRRLRAAATSGPLTGRDTDIAEGLIRETISVWPQQKQALIHLVLDQNHEGGRRNSIRDLLRDRVPIFPRRSTGTPGTTPPLAPQA
jgi:hypothetical protein